MRTISFSIEYDGTPFAGWQRQPGAVVTVQGELEGILRMVLQEQVNLVAAGRTDRGVHARAQVASFTSDTPMELHRLAHALNSLLPPTIRVWGMEERAADFHARFSALERQYRYFLIEEPSAIRGRFAGCSRGPVEFEVMRRLAFLLEGEHDFTAFSKDDRDSRGSLCRIRRAGWYRSGELLVFHVAANRFLRSMVRGLVAALVAAGQGRLPERDFRMMLERPDSAPRLKAAPPEGLFLWRIIY